MGKFEVIGPILNGLNKAVHILQIGNSVQDIINMVMVAVLDAQCVENRHDKHCKDDFMGDFTK